MKRSKSCAGGDALCERYEPAGPGGLDSGWHFYLKLYLRKGHLGGETMADGSLPSSR